jgi:hypothetical protein
MGDDDRREILAKAHMTISELKTTKCYFDWWCYIW